MSATVDDRSFSVETDGFKIVSGVVDARTIDELITEIGICAGPGLRRMLASNVVAGLARSNAVRSVIAPYFVREPMAVRGIFFNKSCDTNWLVTWHQDQTLAVRERYETPGFSSWSVKDGVVHVRPPDEFLLRMLTVRIQFDDADEHNGALRVLPGTHRFGRLSAEQIDAHRRERDEVLCRAKAGDAMLMRPLLLHASQRSTSRLPRRVLHLEFADFALPGGLQWHDAA